MLPTIFYLLFIIFSYLLGSIPFSYLITKIFSKKNVFEVGWKKSSASNVTKNVGKVPGILAFLLDGAKGFLVVYLAQQLGLPPYIQVLSGVSAIFGHNWSIFVGGKGGRGLATLAGGVLAFSPTLLIIVLIPWIIFAIIWTASIGTILSLIVGIFFGLTVENWQLGGLLLAASLLPVFIKRLSPLTEISKAPSDKKRELIENRLLFDQDSVPPFRINILKKTKKEDNIQK
ncbi:MAG: glycerol-3-phosphate acyltransferase [Candidatus Paceibacterota bacterium]|jgi:glycerol-3-phosphate acyltransferase PlsY